MDDSATKQRSQQRKFYLGLALVAVLVVALLAAFLAFQDNPASRDPLLYGNTVTVQVATDKSFYTKGEDVSITVSVINGKSEPVNCTTSIYYKVFDSTGQEVYSCATLISLPLPLPTYPAHSKYSYFPNVWNQKNSNYTLVEPGNYTIKASLEYGTSECEIQIAEYWTR